MVYPFFSSLCFETFFSSSYLDLNIWNMVWFEEKGKGRHKIKSENIHTLEQEMIFQRG